MNIRPGTPSEHKLTVNGTTCHFTYTECNGGTNEEWSMELKTNPGTFICTIERPRPSYLLFKNFKAWAVGENLVLTDAVVINGNGEPLKIPNHWEIKDNEVVAAPTYEGTLSSITLNVLQEKPIEQKRQRKVKRGEKKAKAPKKGEL